MTVHNTFRLTTRQTQTAIVQQAQPEAKGKAGGPLPLAVSSDVPLPTLPPPPHHVLVRVLAVALNPTDHKMPVYLPNPGSTAGCDFCGVVEVAAPEQAAAFAPGTRVCGNNFAYNPALPREGSFAQYILADARQLLRVPQSWTDLEAAALGGVGWKTASLALWDPEMLGLKGRPSSPLQEDEAEPVLVFGGATATGTMACQLLKLCVPTLIPTHPS